MNVKFPDLQKLLLLMDEADQAEVRGQYNKLSKLKTDQQKAKLNESLAKRCHARAQKTMEIVRVIGEPTLDRVGRDGCEAINVLALHSYKQIMEEILAIYTSLYSKDRSNFYYQAIPPLTDKLMILNEKKQYFGTNWSATKDGNFFLIEIKEFQSVNERRSKYGLGAIKRPVILSVGAEKYPLGRGTAVAGDQKKLTNEEYYDFVRYYKKALI